MVQYMVQHSIGYSQGISQMGCRPRSDLKLTGKMQALGQPPVVPACRQDAFRQQCRLATPASAAHPSRAKRKASHIEATSTQAAGEFDVGRVVVDPSFRSTPWAAEKSKAGSDDGIVHVLLVSESNVCRSVLAQSMLQQQLQQAGLADLVHVESRGTREYNVGEAPEASVLQELQRRQLDPPPRFAAQRMDPAQDIVQFDLLLVMDKFTAADVLREVSVYETINRAQQYSKKVRMLGEFHPQLAQTKAQDGQDIDDPLYGNMGGPDEQAGVQRAADVIQESCRGVVQLLQRAQQHSQDQQQSLRSALTALTMKMQATDWLVPPMLQKHA